MKTSNPFSGATVAILLCAAMAGSAHAQVNRCVNAEGQVTLTDDPCPQHSRAVNADVSDNGAVGVAYNSGLDAVPNDMQHVLNNAPVAELPRSRWADLPRPLVRKAIGTDATTLQTARTTLLMRDELRRQGRAVANR